MVRITIFGLLMLLNASEVTVGHEYRLHDFTRTELTDVYYSEGVNIGDINNDGKTDVVHGPYWFEGPSFQAKHEIYPVKAQPRKAYADSFFSWVHDFDADGFPDVLMVGFPGTPAHVFHNPGKKGWGKHWKKIQIFDWVSNESPQFVSIVGDEQPELVCTRDGHFGFATYNPNDPFSTWTFHKISEKVATPRFGHGLGVGDVNGDQRLDVITKNGWYEQPAEGAAEAMWKFHAVTFAAKGGADMFAYDVDGDGDNDVITSLAAHDFGLAWHEQIQRNGDIAFRQHIIMGDKRADSPYGTLFTELHSVNLADIDGDGLKDIVTGKTYWSHHTQSPMWDAGAVVYWFRLVRTRDGVDWIPYLADGEAGIGRQLIVGDVNNDNLPDLVSGGMKGCNVMIHQEKVVDKATWEAAQPQKTRKLLSGLQPEEAAKHMTVPDGFQVTLAAGEPQVHQPVGFTIDGKGRVWVAEAYNYPIRAPEGKGKDKIVILEDTTGDGRLDKRTVFIEGLNLVSGIEVGFGGVWVGAAPYLLFIPDEDGDDRPDSDPQVLLDGFGYQDTHETLNAFIWGPDGWLYGCHGVFTHSLVGKPGTPKAERTPVNAAVWRYHPIRHEFDIFARGTSNPWGVDFNEKGQSFITACVIPHLYHIIQGARYQRQGGRHFNPHLYDDIKTIADHLHYSGNIRDHAWWGEEPELPDSVSDLGGGHAHAGAMIYLGDNWPQDYRNQLFMCNIHGNRVNNEILVPNGSGYIGKHGKDFLFANDKWFRGINLKYGPDGSVYLIDWYDRNACHRTNPLIWDRSNGRIYNVSYGNIDRQKIDIGSLDDQRLVDLLSHENEWYVRMARRHLQHRSSNRNVRRQLVTMLEESKSERQMLRAIWTLHVTGGLDETLILRLLKSPHEYVRAWAIQLELEDKQISGRVLQEFVSLAKHDSSPVVRLYLASALQRLPLHRRWELAASLIAHSEDADDHNLPLMYWYGIEPLVPSNPTAAMKMAAASKLDLITRYITRRASSVDINLVLKSIPNADTKVINLTLDEIIRSFAGQVAVNMPTAWSRVFEQLNEHSHADVREKAERIAVIFGDERIFPKLRAILSNESESIDKRSRSLEILVRGRDPKAGDAILSAAENDQLRGAAIKALIAYDSPQIPRVLLDRYTEYSEGHQRDVVTTLISRPQFALALLDAIDQKKLPRTDLHAYHIRQMYRFEDDQLRRRIDSTWGAIREASADKKKKIAELTKVLSPASLKSANPAHGRRLFDKTCANCHTLFGQGGKVGPDITGSNRTNIDYILENILDPSAVLGKDYRMTLITTDEGQVISGLIERETESALTVRTINDSILVPKSSIESRTLSELSLMPDGLLDQMKTSEIRDLIAYLGSPSQVALQGPKAPIDPSIGRVTGAFEGEKLKVKSASQGTANPQPMGGFVPEKWSNNSQLWWTGAKPGAKLELTIPAQDAGEYSLDVVMTRARDYGIVRLSLNDQPLGDAVDLFHQPSVITTGVLSFSDITLDDQPATLQVEILGANSKAVKAYMFGLDYIKLNRQR